jgi:phosphatidylinositol phospholipase C delta
MSEAEKQAVPPALVAGVPMLKISSKKMKQVVMRLEGGAISWAGSGNSKGQLPSLWRK